MTAAKRPKPTIPPPKPPSHTTHSRDPRNNLLPYILHPETHLEVIEYDADFVVIRDRYPKSTIHLLILPRDPALYTQHPLHALSSNPDFLEKAKQRVAHVKKIAASELRRQFGLVSKSDAPYQKALESLMSSPDPPSPSSRAKLLPQGRDWEKEIISGVHTHPSMNHLHIHVLSRDMHSLCMKHKKHYLSFTTSFMVGLDEFPLEEGSPRFHPGDWPSWDMLCWRCGRNFKNQFARLKEHLEEEFEEWKRE
ncbi:HIT-like protein [Westerdykella ornata]|uniref:Aprataxin-like protein n=1 Tax=Westerdykella ornata TaxID=318751 RepID=A0A6A6J8G0_WESOR|nr:HIT-like protein [Westerdykella ornata]KAF2272655.1 HIT-like protein [Westerdykella ornata]